MDDALVCPDDDRTGDYDRAGSHHDASAHDDGGKTIDARFLTPVGG